MFMPPQVGDRIRLIRDFYGKEGEILRVVRHMRADPTIAVVIGRRDNGRFCRLYLTPAYEGFWWERVNAPAS